MEDKLSSSGQPQGSSGTERPLPRRDIWLLPAIGVLTIIFIFSVSEIGARAVWPERATDPCRTQVSIGARHYKPNCTSVIKSPESPWVNNYYNECGYRTRESCGPKPSGSVRVAVLGSSSSYGYMDRFEDAYTTLLSKTFSKWCGRHFEFQNLGYEESNMLDIYHQTNEAIALKPDLMLIVLSPLDVRHEIDPQAMLHRDDPPVRVMHGNAPPKVTWINTYVVVPLSHSRAVYMLEDAVYHNPETYLNLYLLHGDDAGFLRSTLSPKWQKRLSDTDLLLGEMSKKAAAAGIPLVLVIPTAEAELALLSTPARPGVDPKAFPAALTSIAAHHDIPTIDTSSSYTGQADPMRLFYLVNAHPSDSGERLLANSIEDRLPALVPAVFQGCRNTQ